MAVIIIIFLTLGVSKPAQAQLGNLIEQSLNEAEQADEQALQVVQDLWVPDLARITEQMTATSILATTMIGTFFDAKQQLEVQLLLDQFYVDARRKYQPSKALCQFGSMRTALISSEIKADVTKSLLSKAAIERDVLNKNRVPQNISGNVTSRILEFRNRYCNPVHLGGALGGGESDASSGGLCSSSSSDPEFYDRDINFTHLVDERLTLDLDLTDAVTTDDEKDIMALMNNLYAYNLVTAFPARRINNGEAVDTFMKTRSLWAARSLARNSFIHIVSQKSAGTGDADSFLKDVIRQMGYPEADITKYLGEDPSYDAQMEVLTKRLYQSPHFIVSLIDTPENVARSEASMLASKLMLDRDILEALHRRELLIASILNELLAEEENTVSKSLGQ